MLYKIRLYIPNVIRGIAIVGIGVAVLIALLSFRPDKTDSIKVGSEIIETTVPNPYTLPLACYCAVASILTFGFASVVDAAEQYLYQFHQMDEIAEEESEN